MIKIHPKIKSSKRDCLDGFIFTEKKRHLRRFMSDNRKKIAIGNKPKRFSLLGTVCL
jgi:hypothetical protein